MRKDIKEFNRITLTLFLIGIILLVYVNGEVDRATIFYSLTMSLYYLASELFNFHLWSASDYKEKELKAMIERKEQQHDTTRND